MRNDPFGQVYSVERLLYLDPDFVSAAYEEITGFVKLRIQGGANAVADPQPTGVMLCQEHMTLRKRGISDEQQSLV